MPLSRRRSRPAGAGGAASSRRPATPAGLVVVTERPRDPGLPGATGGPWRRLLPPAALWPYLLRTVLWPPIVAAAGVATLAARRAGLDPLLEYGLAALLLALAVALVLDDPAAAVLAGSPTPLWRRRGLRLAVALPLLAAGWATVGWAAARPGGGPVPTGWATLVLATFAAIVLASAALAGRDSGVGGHAAGPVLLCFVVVAARLPERLALLPVQGHERRWTLVLAVAVLVLLAASADPARRRPWARRG